MAARLFRSTHRWGSLFVALPVLLVIGTGVLLLLKKEFAWIQPPTQTDATKEPLISFSEILSVARLVPEVSIQHWSDIDRLDVRPNLGIIKIRAKNRWELQIAADDGEVLQLAYRRSDLIESLHDGSWFHPKVKTWVFLPCAVVLFILWLTGVYLFFLPYIVRWRRWKNKSKPIES